MTPKTLNIGCGTRFLPECLNADITPRVNPDWLVDISSIEFESFINTRFGEIKIKHEMFSKILAFDVLEHIPNLVKAMENCRDLLEDGGLMEINVPYDLSYGAWQDPTHVRAFNENSWLYYTSWSEKQLGWSDRFELQSLTYVVSEFGKTLKDCDLTKIPRAIDSMHVILKKVKS